MDTSRAPLRTRPLPFALRAGRAAEDAACRYLEAQGLQIVARNFQVRGGEIDIIARDGAWLIFCEVRLRTRSDYGSALHSIDWRKRTRLQHAAACYLQRLVRPPPCRLDALCATGREPWHWQWVQGL